MDPNNIPFKALIMGPTNSGKTQYLGHQQRALFEASLTTWFWNAQPLSTIKPTTGLWITIPKFLSLTARKKRSNSGLNWTAIFFQGTNTLIDLDDCASSKDVKGCTGQLVSLGFSARYASISVWVLTQFWSQALQNHSAKTWPPLFWFTLRRAKPCKPSLKSSPASCLPKSTSNWWLSRKKKKFPNWSSTCAIYSESKFSVNI